MSLTRQIVNFELSGQSHATALSGRIISAA